MSERVRKEWQERREFIEAEFQRMARLVKL
jgi:hypothetical protein